MTAADLTPPRDSRPADRPIDELTFLETAEVARLVASARPGGYEARSIVRFTQWLPIQDYVRASPTRLEVGAQVDFEASIVQVLSGVTRGAESSPKGRRRRSVPFAPSRTAARTLRELPELSHWAAAEDYVFARVRQLAVR